MSEPGGSPLADELGRLAGAVSRWARTNFPAAGAPATDAGVDGEPVAAGEHEHAAGAPQCQWCPLCQFMAVLRGERPDLTERVAEAGTALLSAARMLVDAAGTSAAGTPGPGEDVDGEVRRVRHIDLDDPDR